MQRCSAMSRARFARWLLEKLLGSFVISAIFVYGPFLGMKLSDFGIGTVYTITTGVSFIVSLIVYLIIPGDVKILMRIRDFFSKLKV